MTTGQVQQRHASLDNTSDFASVWSEFEPKIPLNFRDWAAKYVVTDTGRPYDGLFYPQIGALGGPGNAYDDHRVRTIVLQWGVRLGKTFFGSCCLLNAAHQQPGPMMLASSREKLAIDVCTRLYEMIRRGPLVDLLVHPPHLQKRDLIEFAAAKCYTAWARSPSSLADKNIKIGHASEVDKWEHPSTSTEGDPLDLFFDRFNDFLPSRKVIVEGTPSVKNKSRVERLRLGGTNCQFFVPCRACQRYQVLEFGDRDTLHGIKWDPGPDGRSDPDIAASTARYVCRHCREKLPSEDRPWMLRRGVWCPEGATVDDAAALELSVSSAEDWPKWNGWRDAAWIRGKPVRDGETASYHLPTLYAQSIPGWGDFARKFLSVKRRPQSLRAYRNQWEALTWEAAERKTTWEIVGQRIINPHIERDQVPVGTVLLTAGVDKQLSTYPWMVVAWLPDDRSHIVAYGIATELDQIEAQVLQRSFSGWDQQQSFIVRLLLIDSGYRATKVYPWVRGRARRRRVLSAKGASSPLATYAKLVKMSAKSSAPGQRLVLIDGASTQDWVEQAISAESREQPRALSVFAGSLGEHQDLLEQMLNDAPVGDVDAKGNYRENWERIDTQIPNDYRDTYRLALAARQIFTRGAGISSPKPAQSEPESPRHAPGLTIVDL